MFRFFFLRHLFTGMFPSLISTHSFVEQLFRKLASRP
jgi:hypothetical protein